MDYKKENDVLDSLHKTLEEVRLGMRSASERFNFLRHEEIRIVGLIFAEEAKTTLLEQAIVRYNGWGDGFVVDIDTDFDCLTVVLHAAEELDYTVHYLDNSFALLYVADTHEIVGCQIENFSSSAWSKLIDLSQAWFWSTGWQEKERQADEDVS